MGLDELSPQAYIWGTPLTSTTYYNCTIYTRKFDSIKMTRSFPPEMVGAKISSVLERSSRIWWYIDYSRGTSVIGSWFIGLIWEPSRAILDMVEFFSLRKSWWRHHTGFFFSQLASSLPCHNGLSLVVVLSHV